MGQFSPSAATIIQVYKQGHVSNRVSTSPFISQYRWESVEAIKCTVEPEILSGDIFYFTDTVKKKNSYEKLKKKIKTIWIFSPYKSVVKKNTTLQVRSTVFRLK